MKTRTDSLMMALDSAEETLIHLCDGLPTWIGAPIAIIAFLLPLAVPGMIIMALFDLPGGMREGVISAASAPMIFLYWWVGEERKAWRERKSRRASNRAERAGD